MKKYNEGFTALSIIIIVLVLVGLVGFLYSNLSNKNPAPIGTSTGQGTTGGSTTGNEPEKTFASHCGLTITTPAENATATFPLMINGIVDNTNMKNLGCSWQMFEGQAGTASLYYLNQGTWTSISSMTPVPVTNWMTMGPVPFSMTMNFTNNLNLAAGTKMKIIFIEEDAAGFGNPDTLELPFILG